MTDNIKETNNQKSTEEINNICEECGVKQEDVFQNLILTGFKICNSCKIHKIIYPL